MANKSLNKIILKNADWKVRKVNFEDADLKKDFIELRRKQEEALSRKELDSEKLKLVIKL